MSDRVTPRPRDTVIVLAALACGLALAVAPPAKAQSTPSRPPAAPQTAERPAPAALRLVVFSFEHQRASEALSTVRSLLSSQGSVALDEGANTLSVRDSPATLARISSAVRAIDHARREVTLEVHLIRAEVAKVSPPLPSTGVAADLISRMKQLFRFDSFALLARSRIDVREGENVSYEMGQGYRLAFRPGTLIDGRRLRLSDFQMTRSQTGKAETELVRTAVNLRPQQPLILGLTNDESADRALLLVLSFEAPPPLPAVPARADIRN